LAEEEEEEGEVDRLTIGKSTVQSMINEAVAAAHLQSGPADMGSLQVAFTVVVREAGLLTKGDMNNYITKHDLEEELATFKFGGSSMKKVRFGGPDVEERLKALEQDSTTLRNRQLQTCMKKVHDLEQDVLDLRDELEERGMLDNQDSCGEEDRTGDDKYHDDAELQEFRKQLGAGMPVHVAGLVSRPELDGTAGYLEKWHKEKERWQIRLGTETLLVRPNNIVP